MEKVKAAADKQEAQQMLEVLKLAYEEGAIDRNVIVAWADGQIAALDNPPYELIELSTSGQLSWSAFSNLLRSRVGQVSLVSSRAALGVLNEALVFQNMDAVRVASRLSAVAGDLSLSEKEASLIHHLEIEHELVEALEYDSAALQDQIAQFLSLYADFRLGNQNEWMQISETIDQKLLTFEWRVRRTWREWLVEKISG